MFKRISLAICLVFLSGYVGAGAWDIGPFDNDDALDWVWELESSSDFSILKNALLPAARNPSYLEAPDGTIAVAAAEVVAALLGNPGPQLPDEVKAWVANRSLAEDDELVAIARKAITAVQNSEISELAQLWSESEETFDEWRSSLANLAQRLQ